MSILSLNKSTVKLITSTQIITSVSTVVKELVENSLDAGSKNIEVNLSDNGLSTIEIRDDGSGVSLTDVPNMALPHFTSKISEFADLDSLNTYGFRGEALNAICRVAAEVTVTTKTSRDETAKMYTMDNDGNIVGAELSPRFDGTTVRVKKLFDNVPVRRQLIGEQRKSKQDVKYIETILKSLSICNHAVRMSYRVNGCLVFLKPSCADVKEALAHFLGGKVVADLAWIRYEDSAMEIQLMIPKKESNESHLVYEANGRYVIVNNRPVKYKQFEKIIDARISDHFGAGGAVKKRPAYFINVTVPPEDIDVNLEPNKTSVLLKNHEAISTKLDNLLLEYYNICDENALHDTSVVNKSIDLTPEYHDLSESMKTASEHEVPACKRIKLDNKEHRSREFIVDSNLDSVAKRKSTERRSSGGNSSALVSTPSEQTKRSKPPNVWKDGKYILQEIPNEPTNRRSDKDSVGRSTRTFPGPDLSDSDDESNVATETPGVTSKVGYAARHPSVENLDRELANEIPLMKSSVSFALSPDDTNDRKVFYERNAVAYPDENYDETFSQLPVVDLGDDFDIEAILEKPGRISEAGKSTDRPVTTGEQNSSSKETEKTERSEITLELWSKGQIPGLKGPTEVSVLDNAAINRPVPSKENQNKGGDENCQTIYHTGFSKFSHEIRSQVLEENPDATLPLIGKIFANRWKELSPEERGYYRDLALAEKRKAEADKKNLKNNKLSQQETDKNKARLIQMLETMKKTKTTKKCSIGERTTVSWDITVQNITENFFAKLTTESERIIGRLTEEIWVAKFDGKICVINSSEVSREIKESTDLGEQQNILTNENSRTLLSSWLRENKINPSLFRPIHNAVGSPSIQLKQ